MLTMEQRDCEGVSSNHGDYEVPPGALLLSNRSSIMSSGSRGSSSFCSARSSPCASARSSADVSAHDLYDVAPPARAVDGGLLGCVQGRSPLANGKQSLNRSMDETMSSLRSETVSIIGLNNELDGIIC